MQEFTHIDKQGRVRMVDVTDKAPSLRVAVAQGVVSMNPATFEMIHNKTVKKGNVLETARIAGVMAAKKTSDLIPPRPADYSDTGCQIPDTGCKMQDACESKRRGVGGRIWYLESGIWYPGVWAGAIALPRPSAHVS